MFICQQCGGQNGLHFIQCGYHSLLGNSQASDPSEPHRSMPSYVGNDSTMSPGGPKYPREPRPEPIYTDEQKLVALLGPKLDDIFTHRDKGGRYRLLFTPFPAGEVMRKIGDTVVYADVSTKNVYVRGLADFVAIMQPLILSDS